MPSWKGFQIFIEIPINKAKLQSLPHHHTESSYGPESLPAGRRWASGLFRRMPPPPQYSGGNGHFSDGAIGCQGPFSGALAFANAWLRLGVSPGRVAIASVNFPDGGNVIKWLKQTVRTWTSITQSIAFHKSAKKTALLAFWVKLQTWQRVNEDEAAGVMFWNIFSFLITLVTPSQGVAAKERVRTAAAERLSSTVRVISFSRRIITTLMRLQACICNYSLANWRPTVNAFILRQKLNFSREHGHGAEN